MKPIRWNTFRRANVGSFFYLTNNDCTISILFFNGCLIHQNFNLSICFSSKNLANYNMIFTFSFLLPYYIHFFAQLVKL